MSRRRCRICVHTHLEWTHPLSGCQTSTSSTLSAQVSLPGRCNHRRYRIDRSLARSRPNRSATREEHNAPHQHILYVYISPIGNAMWKTHSLFLVHMRVGVLRDDDHKTSLPAAQHANRVFTRDGHLGYALSLNQVECVLSECVCVCVFSLKQHIRLRNSTRSSPVRTRSLLRSPCNIHIVYSTYVYVRAWTTSPWDFMEFFISFFECLLRFKQKRKRAINTSFFLNTK